MKIQTFTIVCGTKACDGHCPWCISSMTPSCGSDAKLPVIDNLRFRSVVALAKQCGATTCLITGKGEPLLFPNRITEFLELIDFPLIELQTNGMFLRSIPYSWPGLLERWRELGLGLVSVSVVHWDDTLNGLIFNPNGAYPPLTETIELLHSKGFSVRLNCMLASGFVDSPEKVAQLVEFAKDHKVEQVTIRNLVEPENSKNEEDVNRVVDAVREFRLDNQQSSDIQAFLQKHGNLLLVTPYGAKVYDLDGQNICLSTCLTEDKDPDNIRQLIFCADQHLRWSWQYQGAILQ